LKPVRALNSVAEEAAIGIASMADQLLLDELPFEITPETIPAALQGYCKGAGMEGRAPWRTLDDLLHESIGQEYLIALGIGQHTLERLAGMARSEGPLRNPVQNIAVVYAIFGGWESMLASIRQQSAANEQPLLERTAGHSRRRSGNRHLGNDAYAERLNSLPKSKASGMRNNYRQWMRERLLENPNLCRSDLKKLPGGRAALRHFYAVDQEYFDKHLPAQTMKYRRQSVSPSKERIAKLEAHIYRQRTLSLSTRPEKRITRSYLLNNSPCEGIASPIHNAPVIRRALATSVDTDVSWRRRVTKCLCAKVRALSEVSVYGDEESYRRLNMSAFRMRIYEARKWMKSQGG
jgi:hypothetical protein